VSTRQAISGTGGEAAAFETRDFYLACFLRCTGYELLDLRAEGRRKVFVFRDRPDRRDDVLAFYGQGAMVAECTKANDAAGATQLARLRGSYLLSGV
jgi:hypothetical protein